MAWSVEGKKKNNRMAGQKSSGETLKSQSVSSTGTKNPFIWQLLLLAAMIIGQATEPACFELSIALMGWRTSPIMLGNSEWEKEEGIV